MGFGFGQMPSLPPGMSAEDFATILRASQLGGAQPPQRAPFGFGSIFGGNGPQDTAAGPDSADGSPVPAFGLGSNMPDAPQAPDVTQAPRPLSFGALPAMPVPDAPLRTLPSTPMPPPRPPSFGGLPKDDPRADMPAPDAVPTTTPPAAPGFATPGATAPATSPAPPAPPAMVGNASEEGSGFLSSLSRPSVYNNLIGIGTAMMSTKGIGNALALGVGNASKLNTQQAATDLAQAEYGLKANKLQREALANNQTYKSLVDRGHAPETVQLAISAAQAGHSDALNNLLQAAVPKPQETPFGWVKQPDGSFAPATGGPQDVNTIHAQNSAREATPAQLEERAAATARGAAAGKPDEPFNLSPGTTRYSADGKPIVSAPDKKPEGFESEGKLRTEFNKNLGTFQDVHDGYGRVLAATEQRSANPKAVSPAADIGLVFGYMKMLDPGSVVREGEYATAANAAGMPERVRNAYNKALSGEFLSPEQRQDFIENAERLYGKARGTAEGVAERYRGLAGQYGVDPGRSVYLPEPYKPLSVGPSRTVVPGASNPLDIGGTRDAGGGITIKRVR